MIGQTSPYALFAVSSLAWHDTLNWCASYFMTVFALFRKRVTAVALVLGVRVPPTARKRQEPAMASIAPKATVAEIATSSPSQLSHGGGRSISEEEVRLHKHREDCWVVLYGDAYDVTEYLPLHPGRDFLFQAAGQDATALFESIHGSRGKFVLHSESFRSQYLVGQLPSGKSTFTFQDPFYHEISAEVEAYFKSVSGSCWARHGFLEQALVYTKFVILVGLSAYTKYQSLLGSSLIFDVLHGLILLSLAFSVTHGACHGELATHYPTWFSRASQLAHVFIGARPEVWMAWHNMSHHQHTNTQHDLDANRDVPVFRIHSHDQYRWYMRYQHFYIWVLYLFMHPVLFLNRDKVCALLYVLACNSLSWCWTEQTCMLRLVVESVIFGFGFVLINQITHTNDKTEYVHDPDETVGWGEHQVRSSSNWCMDNPLVTHLLGGINYQIEHHLFQAIHHMHYPALSNIVRKGCAKRCIPYVAFPTYLSALSSHQRLLVRMAVPS